MKNIVPYEKIDRKMVCFFDIQVVRVVLKVNVEIQVNFFGSEKDFLFSERFILEEEDYEGWGTDDEYLFNLIASKTGVVIIPAPPPSSSATSFEESKLDSVTQVDVLEGGMEFE